MGQKHEQRHCEQCGRPTLHARITTDFNHLPHLLVCLFCFGFWLPFWLLSALANDSRNAREPFRCQFCGRAWSVPQAQLEAESKERIRRWRRRKQAVVAGAEATHTAIRWLLNQAATVWAACLPRLRQIPSLIAALPGAIDRAMRRTVGEENTILIAFIRFVTLATIATALVVLAATLLSTR